MFNSYTCLVVPVLGSVEIEEHVVIMMVVLIRIVTASMVFVPCAMNVLSTHIVFFKTYVLNTFM